LITLRHNFGECGSGWTTATWANMNTTNYDDSILADIERLPIPIRYLGTEIINPDDHANIIHIMSFEGDRNIEIHEIGGDAYYPYGFVRLNNFDF